MKARHDKEHVCPPFCKARPTNSNPHSDPTTPAIAPTYSLPQEPTASSSTMPLSIYVVSIGYDPHHRLMKRWCSRLPQCIKRRIHSISVNTLSSERRAVLYGPEAPTHDPPLYDALPPAYHESAHWAEAVTSHMHDIKISQLNTDKNGTDRCNYMTKADEANIHELE